jgi:hypothetical protein
MLLFTFEGKGTATLLESDGEFVVFEASFSSPPGSPIFGLLDGVSYKVKVRGSKKLEGDPPRFRVEGRFVDLTKAMRERVTTR